MAIQRGALLFIWLVITCYLSVALAIPGYATYFTTLYPTQCFASQDRGVMVAAANVQMWQDKAACGRKYRVTCTGPKSQDLCKNGSVTVKIVDKCAGCNQMTIDLNRPAFAQIADPSAGIIGIDYTQ